MKNFRIALAICITLLVCSISQRVQAVAAATVITFDNLSDQTAVTTQYSNLGVTFSGAVILTCGQTLNCPQFPPYSFPNVIYDGFNGAITATFSPNVAPDVRKVSARVTGNRNITMTAFDALGHILAVTQTGGANFVGVGTPNALLVVESTGTPIAMVTFHDSGNTYTIDDFSFETGSRPDLKITQSNIVPIQSVQDVDINGDGRIDLVQNKPTVVRSRIDVINPSAIDSNQSVELQLTFQGNTQTQNRTVAELIAGPVDFYITPNSSGDGSIEVTIDPQGLISESDENNNQASRDVTVKSVRDIQYAYMEVDYLDSTPDFYTTVSNSGDYLQGVYPIAPTQFLNQPLGISFSPALAGLLPSQLGAEDDALNLWLEGKLLTLFHAERIIGIVPKRWFTYHRLGDSTEGVVFPMVREAAFVLDNHPLVTAHEVGHTYGFGEGYVLNGDGTCCLSDGDPTSGFWVQRRREITNSIDFMGDSPGFVSYPSEAGLRWATASRFSDLFSQFRTQPNDPEILLITGTISMNGTVTLGDMYRVMDGTVSQSSVGDGSVRVIDGNGNILTQITFTVDFHILTDPPVTTDTAPFAFAIPYLSGAAAVQIVQNGKVLAQTVVSTKLLHDAVASLPDAAFEQNPSERRNALLNKIDAFDQQLLAKNIMGARNNLRNDIRKQLESWLRDDYPTTSAREYTKAGILTLVDELLQRLSS